MQSTTALGKWRLNHFPTLIFYACRHSWAIRTHSFTNTLLLLFLLLSQWSSVILPVGTPLKTDVLIRMKEKKDVQQGTLALMVLKTLDVLGPLHGYAVAHRIERISDNFLSVNQAPFIPFC